MIDSTHDPARGSWVASANGHREFPDPEPAVRRVQPARRTPARRRRDRRRDPRPGACLRRPARRPGTRGRRGGPGATLNPFLGLPGRRGRRCAPACPSCLSDGTAPRVRTCRAAAAPGGRLRRFTCRHDRRLHRFLRRHPSRHQRRPSASARQPADAELQIRAGRLSRPRVVGAVSGEAGAPAERPAQAAGARRRRASAPAARWTTSWNLASGSAPATRWASPSRSPTRGAHIAGLCLLNDWSARDIQTWESAAAGTVPGEELSTTISPWIVTAEALAPFRRAQPARPEGDPAPLPYLLDAADQEAGAFDIAFEVTLLTPGDARGGHAAPHRLSRSHATDLYWTVAQMVAHHTCGGCDLRPGDLFGSGTMSGATEGQLRLPAGNDAAAAATPVALPNGETRTFLQDGDEVCLQSRCSAPGRIAIGFGECRGIVNAARTDGRT